MLWNIKCIEGDKLNFYYIPDNYNIGLAILRAYMCFGVVLLHFWKEQSETPIIIRIFFSQRIYAVPVFMLSSFIITNKFFSHINVESVRKRLYRILYPHFVWGGITI